MLDLGVLNDEGETPLTIKAEVGVKTSPIPSLKLEIAAFKVQLKTGGPN